MTSREKKPVEKREDSVKSEIGHRLKTHPFIFIGTVLVLVIVIVAFVFVPAIVPDAQMGGALVFGYYNNTPIRYARNNYFDTVLQNISQSMGLTADNPNYVLMLNWIWRQAFDETALQLGILDEMKTAGYVTPEDVVDREMASLQMFQENGRFSNRLYRSLDRTTQTSIWRNIQDSIAVNNYISLSALNVSSKETSFIGSMAAKQRTFDVAVFPLSSYPDSEVAKFAGANLENFRSLHLSIITITSSEQEANSLLGSVTNGTLTFEEAAQSNSTDIFSSVGGDMGTQMLYELKSVVLDENDMRALVDLPQGSLSGVIKVTAGWAFFRSEEASRPADLTDSSQLAKIRTYIMLNNRGTAEDWLTGEAERFSQRAGEIGFDDAAIEGNITRHTLGPIPVNYGDTTLYTRISSSGLTELAAAGSDPFFWRAAFSTPMNTFSAPIVTGDYLIVLFPKIEIDLAEDEIEIIESYYPTWIAEGLDQRYRSYFLTSEKLEDNFEETFDRVWVEE